MPRARIALLPLFLAIAARAAGPSIDLPKEIPDEPFDIRANRIEYTNGTLIASGGVTGRFENAEIRADRISGNPETGDLRVDGDIHFERGNMLWQGSGLDYNYLTQTGNFGPSSLDFDPVLMSVDHVERVSTNEFLLRGATFTTCPLEKQHYHVRAKEARLVDQKYLIAKGVTVYIGSVPVFYMPYWRQQLTKSIFTFKAGYGSEWGAFALVTATIPLTDRIESATDFNLYSRRGVGLGQGFSWEYPQAVGKFAAFYLRDEDPYAKYDSPEAMEQIDTDRYRIKLEHLQHFTDTHYFNTKWNYLSDPAIVEEFFKSEHRESAQPENYASWVYGNSTVGTEAFVNKRINDFYDNTDRAEYSLDLYRSRIAGSPFYFQSENSVAALERVFSETNTVDDAYDSARVDSLNTLFLPQRYGFLSLVPRASYRATYYSKSVAATGGGEELRQIPGVGLEASVEATKTLSERERWYGRGLRHKIQPYADYIYEQSSVSADALLQFDGIDQMDDENKTKLGVRNVLQTQRDGQVARFIDLDLYTYHLIEKETETRDFDLLYIDARMPLTQRTMIDYEGRYDWYRKTLPFSSTRISHDRDDYVISLEHLYRDSIQSLWTPRIDLYPKGPYSLEAYARYEGRENDLEEIAVVGYANRCCMRYGLGFQVYDDGELRIMFSVGLSAFPEASISSKF